MEPRLDVRQRLVEHTRHGITPVYAGDVPARVAQDATDLLFVPQRLPSCLSRRVDRVRDPTACDLGRYDRFRGGLGILDVELEGVEVKIHGLGREAQDRTAGRVEVVGHQPELELSFDPTAVGVDVAVGMLERSPPVAVVPQSAEHAVHDRFVPGVFGRKASRAIHLAQQRGEGAYDIIAIELVIEPHAVHDQIKERDRHLQQVVVFQLCGLVDLRSPHVV
jgi:hypothetical protein